MTCIHGIEPTISQPRINQVLFWMIKVGLFQIFCEIAPHKFHTVFFLRVFVHNSNSLSLLCKSSFVSTLELLCKLIVYNLLVPAVQDNLRNTIQTVDEYVCRRIQFVITSLSFRLHDISWMSWNRSWIHASCASFLARLRFHRPEPQFQDTGRKIEFQLNTNLNSYHCMTFRCRHLAWEHYN